MEILLLVVVAGFFMLIYPPVLIAAAIGFAVGIIHPLLGASAFFVVLGFVAVGNINKLKKEIYDE